MANAGIDKGRWPDDAHHCAPLRESTETTHPTCVECGHVANVSPDCARWACLCGRIQATVQP